MALKFKDYSKPGSSEWIRTCTYPGSEWVEMVEVRPTPDAIAQMDGTWVIPAAPDLDLGEVESLVAMFPVSYGYVLQRLGFGDIV